MSTYFEEIGLVPHAGKPLLFAYAAGFTVSLMLTLGAYAVATSGMLPLPGLYLTLGVLALVQFAVQVVLFLHLGTGAASREKLYMLAGVSTAVLILVAGSIWIMLDLHGRMMVPEDQMRTYMEEQPGL